MNKSHPKQYDFIDGLRGIAVLWVMAHHFLYGFNARPAFVQTVAFFKDHNWSWAAQLCSAAFNNIYVRLTFFGNYGVDIFFVISGFLITRFLIDFIDKKIDIRRFYVRRFFKIVPHYYFVVAVAMTLAVIFTMVSMPDALKQAGTLLLFQQNYQLGPEIFGHTWSLVIEEQFYIFWGLVLWVLSLGKRSSSQRLFWAVLISGALIILIGLHRSYFYDTKQTIFQFTKAGAYPIQMFSLRADGLMGGCLLRLFLPYIETLKSRAWGSYALGLLLYVVLLAAPIANYGIPLRWWDLTLAWLAPACFIIAGVNGCSLIFSRRSLQLIGKNSYGIYLVHLPLLKIFENWAAQQEKQSLIIGFLFILSSIGAGMATTYCVEKRFLRLRETIAP